MSAFLEPRAVVAFTVFGRARPAGALQIGTRKDGNRFLHHRDAAPLRDFKAGIRAAAGEQMGSSSPWRDPAGVFADFYFQRPAAHFGTGKNAERLKASAPAFPSNRAQGDGDKLARSLLDALSGIVFVDDSQVAALTVFKRWAEQGPERVQIQCWRCCEIEAQLSLSAISSITTY